MIAVFCVIGISCSQSGSENKKQDDNAVNLVTDTIHISGMHCDMCVSSIEKGVHEVEGVKSVEAILDDSLAVVQYDQVKTDLKEIKSAVVKRGYTVKE